MPFLLLVSLAAAHDPAVSLRGDALFDAWRDVFEADVDDVEEAHGRCATGVVEALRLGWSTLSEDQRARVAGRLSPDRADPWSAGPVPPPVAGDTCWGQESDNRVLGEHFSVEWDDGVTDEETAQGFLDAMEYAWVVAVEEWGWVAPDGTDDYLMQVTIEPGGASAYTTIRNCGGQYIPYVVAGEGSFNSERWSTSMAAHEFIHTSQFSYSYAHEFWWWEATATWFEEYSHPDDNVWAESILGYSLYPHIAMNAFSQTRQDVFSHMYGMAVWAFYLDEYVGGHDLVRQTWEHSAGMSGQYTLTMEETLSALEVNFWSTYQGFAATNTVMAYEDQGLFLSPSISETLDALPITWDVDDGRGQRPETLGQSFVRVDPDAATDELPDLEVTFAGEAGRSWQVLLVGEDNDEVEVVERLYTEDGVGTATLRDFGSYDMVWLVASPLVGDGGGDFSVDVAAIALPDEDTGDAAIGGGEAKSCGCVSGGGAVGLWLLLPALLLSQRRKK